MTDSVPDESRHADSKTCDTTKSEQNAATSLDDKTPATQRPSVESEVSSVQRPKWWRWAIALTACFGAVMEVIDTSIVNVALPHIQATMGVTVSEVGWTITGYAMANVVMIPLSAWLGEVFGKKNYFIFCLIGFTMSSILCGMAHSLEFLVAARFLQGLTGGGLLAKAQGILFETFTEKKEQALAQALFGMGMMVGPALGPVLGGYLTDSIGWRWIFYINVPFGILAVISAVIFFHQDKPRGVVSNAPKRAVDWWGIGFLAVGLGSLQIMLEEGYRDEWFQSPFIVLMGVLAAIGLTLFVWQELTTDSPAVDLRVLRHPALAAGSLFSVVLGIALYGSVFAIPIFAQSVLGFSATQTGLLMLPAAIASALFMIVSSILAQKFDARFVVFAGALVMAFSMFQLAHITPDTGADDLYWPNILRGLGTVLMFLPLTLATMSTIPVKEIHAATGFFNLTRQIGGSVGIAVLTTLLDQRQTYHHSVLVEHVSRYEPAVRQQLSGFANGLFAGNGVEMAQKQAYMMMERMVSLQAMVLSFEDIFWFVGSLVLLSTILIIFLGTGKKDPNVTIEMH